MPTTPCISRPLSLVAVLILLSGLVIGAAPSLATPIAAQTVPVAGNHVTLPRGAHVVGVLPANQLLHLVVGLNPRHADLLDTFLRWRRHTAMAARSVLTPAQFAALFSPTAAAQATVVAYLRAHGLHIARTYPDRLLIDASGTVRQVAAAFDVTLVRYRDRRGQVYFANATEPRLPAVIARLVGAIVGLRDDAAPHHVPHPRVRSAPRVPTAPPAGLLTPSQLQTAYDITPIYSQAFAASGGVSQTAAITGAGQTIALYELSPYNLADIAAYNAAFGLNATPPISIAVDGGATNTFGGTGTTEAALDIELVQAVAPGAQILIYSGPASPSSNDNTGADDTYARIVNDDLAGVLSTSWGQCEPDQQADNPPDLTLLHNLFAQAVAEGMTVLASSGDSGANDCIDGRTNPSVDYPASDPYAVAVGGTTLTSDASGHVVGETGWANNGGASGSSGGGPSAVWPRPAWQTGPGVPAGTMREVPDVALNAGQRYAVWVNDGWTPVIGTSAGPPVWAAILALANQSRYVAAAAQGTPAPAPCAMLPGFGDVHAALYGLAATPGPAPAFRDITTGSTNGVATPGPGWDAVTGWGVPDAYTLLRALIAMPAFAPPAPRAGPCFTATATPSASPSLSPTGTATPTATNAPSSSPGGAPSPLPTSPSATWPPITLPTQQPGSAAATPPARCTARPTPTRTPAAAGTTRATATPTGMGGQRPVFPATTATRTPGATSARVSRGTCVVPTLHPQPGPHRIQSLSVSVLPRQVAVGGVVTLQVRGASGRGQRVAFEIQYPGQKPQRLHGTTDRHGAVTVRVRVPRTVPRNRALAVQVRVTVQAGRSTLVRWARFRITPHVAICSGTQHVAPSTKSCRTPHVQGSRPCA